MYALVLSNQIIAEQMFLPESARSIVDPGVWVVNLPLQPVPVQQSTGWYQVVSVDRPQNTLNETYDRTLVFDGNSVVESWDQRSKTPDELEQERLATNFSAIEAEIDSAIVQLDSLIAAPAVPTVQSGTMSTAQLSNTLRVMRDYIQENRAGAQQVALRLKQTIKLVRGDYDTVT